MKKILATVMLLLMAATGAFASNETIEDLIGQLEGKDLATIARERQQRQALEAAQKEFEALRKQFDFSTDRVVGITWVHSRLIKRTPYMSVYMGKKDGLSWLRLYLEPGGSFKRLDAQEIIFNVDGSVHRFEIPPDRRSVTVDTELVENSINPDVKNVRTWYRESADMLVPAGMEAVLLKVSRSSRTEVRIRGLYNADFVLSAAERKDIGALLRYRELEQMLLTGSVPLVGAPSASAEALSAGGDFVEIVADAAGRMSLDWNTLKDRGEYVTVVLKTTLLGESLKKALAEFGESFSYYLTEMALSKTMPHMQFINASTHDSGGKVLRSAINSPFDPGAYAMIEGDAFTSIYNAVTAKAVERGYLAKEERFTVVSNRAGAMMLNESSIEDGGSYVVAEVKIVTLGSGGQELVNSYGQNAAYVVMSSAFDKTVRQYQIFQFCVYDSANRIIKQAGIPVNKDNYTKIAANDVFNSAVYDRVLEAVKKR